MVIKKENNIKVCEITFADRHPFESFKTLKDFVLKTGRDISKYNRCYCCNKFFSEDDYVFLCNYTGQKQRVCNQCVSYINSDDWYSFNIIGNITEINFISKAGEFLPFIR